MKSNVVSKFLSMLLILVLLLTPVAPLVATDEAPVSLVPALMTGNEVSLSMQIDSTWEGYFNGTITLTNTGEKPIENWALSFSFPHVITNIWNGVVFEQAEGMLTVKNAGWNQDVPAGGSVSFGFTAQQNGEALTPDFYFINTAQRTVSSADYIATYKLKKDWGTGFSGELTLENISSQTIEDWSFSMDFARTITTASNTVFTQGEGIQYLLNNPGYDQNINSGKSIKIGIQGTGGVETDVPSNFLVSQVTVGVSLTGDYDADGVKDYEELVIYGTDPLVSEETTPTPTPVPTLTPTPVPTLTPTPTSTPVPTPTSTPTPTPAEDMDTDTDGDGIPDYYEIEIGTDPLLIDTDGDGIDDMTEIIFGMDPLTSDLDEDFDGDGFTLRQELELGTEFWNEDTDYDGLLDGEEVNTYGTDPLLEDTDGDGLLDGDEIILGLDPLVTDSNGNGVSDGQEKILQTVTETVSEEEKPEVTKVTVSMSAAGNIQNTTQIKSSYNVDIQTSGVVGLIGAPVEITSESTFDEATITFHYDETALGEVPEENLAIMWYDEANNVYIIMDEEDVLDTVNNTISLTTTHFSTYLVVDKEAWYSAWRQGLDTLSELRNQYCSSIPVPKFDFVFALQGNMSSEMYSQAMQITEGFTDSMQEGDRCGLLFFGEKAFSFTGWGFFSKYTVISMLSNSKSIISGKDSSSYMLDLADDLQCLVHAVGGANYLFYKVPESTNKKIVIMISNGVNVSREGGQLVWEDPDYEPTVYTIRMGTLSGSDKILEDFAQDSGGEFYIADTAENIRDKFYESNDANLQAEIDATDSDSDGIPDIYETTGMLVTNGTIIYTDPLKADSDDDGLSDGQEMGTMKKVSDGPLFDRLKLLLAGYENDERYFNYFDWDSDPNENDGDGDKYLDVNDPRPLTDDVEIIDLKHIDYIEVACSDGTYSYGGSQSWANPNDDASYGSQNYMIDHHGCGLIAFTDMILWLQGKYAISQTEYLNLVRDYNTKYVALNIITGVIGPDIAHAFNYYRQFDEVGLPGYPYCASWEWNLNYVTMLEKIEEMLSENIPVIMSIGPNTPDFINKERISAYVPIPYGSANYDITDTDCYYQFEIPQVGTPGEYKDMRIGNHYFTITGVLKDGVSQKTMLRISTWGTEYYIDYDEYREYVENVGGRWTSSIISMDEND